ncbi:MAG TPA: hypothetical protein V6D23_15775 [Candidatus Obscuribacterales bacterium]
MNHLDANLKALQIHQPESWSLLRACTHSPFSIDTDRRLHFGAEAWPLAVPLPELAPATVALFVYGMGDGELLRRLRACLDPLTPIVVLDSQPQLAWTCLGAAGLEDLIADERLQWLVDQPERLEQRLDDVCRQLQDRFGVAWIENPPVARLGEQLEDGFLALYRQQAQALAGRSSLERLPDLATLYAQLEPEMARAYASYPLSCRSGCAGCCERSVGFHLCLNPLEWALLHRSLMALAAPLRREIFTRAVRTLARHADFLVELLHYFDAQPERVEDAAFHQELLQMARERHQEACVFLGPERACQVYAGRPFSCRVFGNSHVHGNYGFTCELDSEKMDRILLAEGPAARLVDSEAYRTRLWALHQDLEHKQVLHLWVLTHLDFATGDFRPLRLDYQQFQTLVRQPAELDKLLADLATAAGALGSVKRKIN